MDKIYQGLEKRITPQDAHYFYGYFDKCPWNSRGEHPVHKVPFAARQPYFGEKAELGFARDGKFEKFAETSAWCWQLGSMMQFLDDETLIWNDVESDHLVSRLSNGKILPRPIYCLSPDHRYALSVNFSRLDTERPGYGYGGLPDPSADFAHPENDGIFRMDLESGESKLIVSLSQIVKEFPCRGCFETMNWFNHLLFSPDGKKISFIHRFRTFEPGGSGRRFYVTRMFTANADGSNLWALPMDYHASHYTWIDPEHLIVYSRVPYQGGNQFRIYTVGDYNTQIFAMNRLPNDGHCSFSPDGKLLLTDSYPDGENMRTLVLYDPQKDCRYDLGRYYSPAILHATRCDLHPRWSQDGRRISFDSFHEEYRGTYVIDIPEEILC